MAPTDTPIARESNPERFTLLLSYDGRTAATSKDRVVIGAMPSSDVLIQSAGVSPIHAVLEVSSSGDVKIFDLASETGVFVNRARVVSGPVKSGDRISIGETEITVSIKKESIEGAPIVLPGTQDDLKPLLLVDESKVVPIFDYTLQGEHGQEKALEVVLSWQGSILDIQHFYNAPVYVGPVRGNDFVIPQGLGEPRFAMITARMEGSGTAKHPVRLLNLDPEMSGVVQTQGGLIRVNKGDPARTLTLGSKDFAKLSVGETEFYLSSSPVPPTLIARRRVLADPFLRRSLLASLALVIAALSILLSWKGSEEPPKPEELPPRLAAVILETAAKVPPPPRIVPPLAPVGKPPSKVQVAKTQPVLKKDKTPSTASTGPIVKRSNPIPPQPMGKEGAGPRATGQKGTLGSTVVIPPATTHEKLAQRTSPTPGDGRGGAASETEGLGNLQAIEGAGKRMQGILGASSEKLGEPGKKLEGYGGRTTRGSGGLSLADRGTGGGGKSNSLQGEAEAGSGAGRVGTGAGALGTGSKTIGGKTQLMPLVQESGGGSVSLQSAIDPEAVASALNRHRDEFMLCYEREINMGTPNLAGNVYTEFTIGPAGRTLSERVKGSTINNKNVESCVLEVIRRVQFPRPRGGGSVSVNYPFKYRPVQNSDSGT